MKRSAGTIRRVGVLLLFLFVVLFTTIYVSAEETEAGDGKEEPIAYELFVGGVQVTSDNLTDVCGEGENAPQVTYDPAKKLLTVRGGQAATLSAAAVTDAAGENRGTYSLYSTIPDIRVVVSGTVTCTHGIRLASGSLTADGATITYLGGADCPTYVTVDDGSITIQGGSKIIGKSLENVTANCFSATTILVQTSDIGINVYDADEAVANFSHVLFGKQSVRIRNSEVTYRAELMGCDIFIASDGAVQIVGSIVRAQNIRVFLLLGGGKLTVTDNSMLQATKCLHGLQIVGDAEIKHSSLWFLSHYSGIEVSPIGGGSFRAQDTTFTVIDSGYGALEREILLPEWNRSHTDDAGLDDYLVSCRAQYEKAMQKAEHAGFYANRSSVEIANCTLNISGYTTGIFYRAVGRTLALRDGCRLSIDAVRAAFVALVTEADAVSFGSRTNGDVTLQVKQAGETLGDYGTYLVTLTEPDTEIVTTATMRIGTPQAVLDAYSGMARKAEATIDEFRASSIVLPLAVLVAASGGAVAVYLLCCRLRRRNTGKDAVAETGGETTEKGGDGNGAD